MASICISYCGSVCKRAPRVCTSKDAQENSASCGYIKVRLVLFSRMRTNCIYRISVSSDVKGIQSAVAEVQAGMQSLG